jgi:hypothetical protein
MNWDGAAQAIHDYFRPIWAAAYPLNAVPVYYEGDEPPDLTQTTQPFLTFEVAPQRARQSGMLGDTPPLRYHGSIFSVYFARESGRGKAAMQALDVLTGAFTAKNAGGVVFMATVPLPPVVARGWRSRTLMSSFYFDSIT